MTAFFNKKKTVLKKEVTKKPNAKKLTVVSPVSDSSDASQKTSGLPLTSVLMRPHVTEKATDLSTRGVYVFEVSKLANKMHVRQAIEKLYKVVPTKIAMVNGRPKLMKNPRTGRLQAKQKSIKKALVYLKKGDKIEFV